MQKNENSEIKVAISIPCYNEVDNLELLISNIRSVFSHKKNIKVFLVNNGSTDSTLEKMRNLVGKNNLIEIVDVTVNVGYGNGIKAGLRHAKDFDVVGWTHADLQTDMNDVKQAIGIYLDSAERNCLVKGKRINRKMSEKFFSWGMELFSNVMLNIRVSEVNAQPKLMSRDLYMKHELHAPDDFSFDLYYLYQASIAGVKIYDFPVSFSDREFGVAKGGGGANLSTKWKLIKRTFKYIHRMRKERNV